MSTKKVWFVTGASKGLGLTLVKRLLNEGYRVAATSRNVEELSKEVGTDSASFLPLKMELTDEKSVASGISKTVETFGSIDVIVNNAGYGQLGAIEELSDEETRRNFDINVFGSLNVIRNVMPLLRKQKSGRIINIASIGGFAGAFPGVGVYCATKFAIAGLTEALSTEVKEFGISATVVYPGYFRTNFLGKGSVGIPKNRIAEYTAAGNATDWHANEQNGNQPGDPEKAALAFIQLAEAKNPPLHLFLGSDALQLALQKIEAVDNDLRANEALTKSTDF